MMSLKPLPVSLVLLLPLVAVMPHAQAKGGQPGLRRTALHAGWEFRQVLREPTLGAAKWRTAEVPGCVHLDLLRHRLIPDPFFRDNEAKLQWIEQADWEYRTTIQADADLLAHRNVEIVFDGLDSYAEVFLNDRPVLTADNMFRQWRVDLKPFLRAGPNVLRILFPSPIRAAAKAAASDPLRLKVRAEEKTYVRKAAYEHGWDWGPRFVTSGVWRPVHIEVWDAARIAGVHIRQRDVSAAVAHIVAEVEVTASEERPAEVRVDVAQAGSKLDAARKVRLRPGLNHVDVPIEIRNPALWFPAGYGAQPLYELRVRLQGGDQVEDEASRRTGLRSILLRREVDRWGRSFELVINGIPVFAKGANVIPFDSFPTRVTTAQYRRVLESARDANMNMIRHWGGGYYESDEFYDLCDELGILIWQDFMFGNDWQPGLYAFKLNVTREAEDQLRRLRDHPSIVLWCGNNETESAFTWGERKTMAADARLQMWQDYLTLFSGILARAVERLSPETPYWPSSPSADYEETSDAYASGDMHDWSVWHGRVPFSDYKKHFPRFMTEYGFQSFPEMRSVESFTTPEDRAGIFSDVMLAHQKNNAGNAIIRDYLLRDYAEPRDFAAFLYASQVLQAEGIKVGAEHLRRTRPRAMGSLYWQLNDCWPVASWSSIDYFGRWKALHYYARRFYSPLLVSPNVEDGSLTVYVVSDRSEAAQADLRVRLLGVDGTVVSDKSQAIEIPPLSSRPYVQVALTDLPPFDPTRVVVATELSAAGKLVSSNLAYLVPTKQFKLLPAVVASELTKSGDRYSLRLSSKLLARSVHVSFGSLDAQVSDNYFDLLPGEPLEVDVRSAAGLEELRSSLKVVSLVDAFPPPGSTPAAKVD
jgi:beta-mannosidase